MKKLSKILAVILCLTILIPATAFAATTNGVETFRITVNGTPSGQWYYGTDNYSYTDGHGNGSEPDRLTAAQLKTTDLTFKSNNCSYLMIYNLTNLKSIRIGSQKTVLSEFNTTYASQLSEPSDVQVKITPDNNATAAAAMGLESGEIGYGYCYDGNSEKNYFVIYFKQATVNDSFGLTLNYAGYTEVTVSADPAAPIASSDSQTITVTVDFDETVVVNAISAEKVYVPDDWTVDVKGLGYAGESGSAEGTVGVGYDASQKKIAGGWSSDEDYRHIHGLRFTYTAAANAQGDFTLGCEGLTVGNTAGVSVINGVNATQSVTIAASTPAEGYTVTISDGVDGTAEVEIDGTVTMTVTVSGAAFNGIEGTVSYDKTLFELTSVTGDAAADKASTDEIELYALENTAFADGAVVATLKFTALAAGEDSGFTFTGTVGDYAAFAAHDAVAATAVNDSVTVKAQTKYEVKITSVEHATIVSDKTEAAEGETVTITVTPADNYKVDSVTITDENGDPVSFTDNKDGTYTVIMPASKITVSVTVSEIPPAFTVAVSQYVTGINLVLVTGEAAGYTYNGQAMYQVAAYGANVFAYLDDASGLTQSAAAGLVAEATATAADHVLASGNYEVNGTSKVDFNDAGAAFGCYNAAYALADNVAMYLRADVDGSKTVDGTDVSDIMDNYS